MNYFHSALQMGWLLICRFRLPLMIGVLLIAFSIHRQRTSAILDWRVNGPMPPKVEVIRTPEQEEKVRLAEDTIALLEAKQYHELDALAAKLRSSKAMDPFGFWHLNLFYDALAELPSTAADSEWRDRISKIAAWSKEAPESVTARVALAYVWVEFAWDARGTGLGSSVSDSAWQLFYDRMARAHDILRKAPEAKACPTYYLLLQRIALIEDWDRREVDKLVSDAIKAEPTYTHYYRMHVNYLLPRWHGRPGEWQAFAEDCADLVGGDEGDILYTRIVWYLWSYPIVQQNKFFKEYPETYDRTRKGMALIHARYPESLNFTSHYCNFAAMSQEQALARTLLAKIDGRVDLSVWGGQSRFVDAYKWANY